MVKLLVEEMRDLMKNSEKIRIITIIAGVEHGKSTLEDFLLLAAGVSLMEEPIADNMQSNNTVGDQQRNIIIKSTIQTLYYEIKKEPYLINLVDYPRYSDLTADLKSLLRVNDGTMLLVDCIEGITMQTENIFRQAMQEKIKPILMINKIDNQIIDLQIDSETIYQNYIKIIDMTNIIISNYDQSELGDLILSPEKGNVAFGSGFECWGFTLNTFSRIYSKKFKIDESMMMHRLWGDNYYDYENKKWKKNNIDNNGNVMKRAFCAFVIDPIIKLARSIMEGNKEQYCKICQSINVDLAEFEKVFEGRKLFKTIMQKWINVADALLEMIVINLPSPIRAQKYRYAYLYEGPLDDECAIGIKNCNPNAPLMLYVSRIIPTSDKSKFFSFGRVFSGNIEAGQKVKIMGLNYNKNKKDDLFNEKLVESVVLLMGRKCYSIPNAPCGNIVGLVGVDEFLIKSGTLTNYPNAYPFKSLKCSLAPIIKVELTPKNAQDLPKLIEALNKLSKFDPLVQCNREENGNHYIEASSELHLDICLHDLQTNFISCEIIKSDPILVYKETISEKSSQVCLSKSPNKHNRLYCMAEPLQEGLSQMIEHSDIKPADDQKIRGKILVDNFGWDPCDVYKIWAFGPKYNGPNLFVDMTKGVQYIHEHKDSIDSAFQWATKEGVICEETMRGIRINLVDIVCFADAIHRGGGQIIPTARRVCYACELTATPRLMEPIYLCIITSPLDVLDLVYQFLNQRNARVIEEEQIPGTLLYHIKANIAVNESFGDFFSH